MAMLLLVLVLRARHALCVHTFQGPRGGARAVSVELEHWRSTMAIVVVAVIIVVLFSYQLRQSHLEEAGS